MAKSPESGQGTTVVFNGSTVSSLLTFNLAFGEPDQVDTTPLAATVVGTGENARVFREVRPVSVTPGSVSVTCLGMGLAVDASDVGMIALLTCSGQWGSVSGTAYLSRANVSASVGEFVIQSLEWKYIQ